MYVDFIRSSKDNCRVIFHNQHPDSLFEHFQGQFKDAGIDVLLSSIRKEIPEVPTTPPTVRIVVTLTEAQYEGMIRKAFGEDDPAPTVLDAGTF